ncbi:MAG: HEAT repeat domain-containing protein [Alphaproteobacteria bacterium]
MPLKHLLLALVVMVGGFSTQARAVVTADEATLARLRAAESVLLVVDQSYVFTPRTAYRKDPIEGYQLPFARISRYLLEDAGLRVIEPGESGAPTDVTLTISAQGRAIARLYLDGVKDFLYTGAEIIGDITFTAPGMAPWSTEFSSQYGPPLRLNLNLGFDRPEGAPFMEAFNGATSFIAKLMAMVGKIHGAPTLIAALGDGNHAVRLYAARTLGTIDEAGVSNALMELLGDSDGRLRKEAAWSLGQLRVAAAAPALTVALDDPDADVRWFAAWALARLEKDLGAEEPTIAPGN